MSDPFYVTTPIYYVNDEPHLGHAYTTILADVLARFARLAGRETFFLTGTDEHGLKVQRSAQEHNVTPQVLADTMVTRFQKAWVDLHISNDDFIRTTEPRHIRVVETILQRLWDQGDIYLGTYEGWYCVPDERFWTEKDLLAGHCPDCGRMVERLEEPNYFFRMSAYQEWLVDYINSHPDFIQPSYRTNEVLGYLRQPLNDLSISRPISRLNWGIPLPFDSQYVTYVWFDALLNYVTAAGYLNDGSRFDHLWPNAIHLIGKDILTTHCVYWPTMLQAAGLRQPKSIFAHGWWITSGTKMSKSLGNVVKPLDLAQIYGVDALRFFLMRDMSLGRDANFNERNLARRYHAELANDYGNLLHRLVNMIGRYFGGMIPEPGDPQSEDDSLKRNCLDLIPESFDRIENMALNEALAEIMSTVRSINVYLERTSPWSRASTGDMGRVATILYFASEALRLTSILLHPVTPERSAELWRRLGWQPDSSLNDNLKWGLLKPGTQVVSGPPLFPKL